MKTKTKTKTKTRKTDFNHSANIVDMEKQILTMLSARQGHAGAFGDIKGGLHFPRRYTTLSKSSFFSAAVMSIVKKGLVEIIGMDNRMNVYRLTGRGQAHITMGSSLLPIETKYPYMLLDRSVINALANWREIGWKTPIGSNQLNNTKVIPFNNFLKAIYARDLLVIELTDKVETSVKVREITGRGQEIIPEMLKRVEKLVELLGEKNW